MVGYHGVSSRSTSQRQSGAQGSNAHTGYARAPARHSVAVPTEIAINRDLSAGG